MSTTSRPKRSRSQERLLLALAVGIVLRPCQLLWIRWLEAGLVPMYPLLPSQTFNQQLMHPELQVR